MSNDMILAKVALLDNELSLVLARNGRILFKSKSHGIADMIGMIDELGKLTEGASLADSVVGRAAALLCVYAGIVGVYGSRMSEGAVSILKSKGIHHEFGTLVPRILNRRMNDVCPFDKAVSDLEEPAVALEKLRSTRTCATQQ